MSARKP